MSQFAQWHNCSQNEHQELTSRLHSISAEKIFLSSSIIALRHPESQETIACIVLLGRRPRHRDERWPQLYQFVGQRLSESLSTIHSRETWEHTGRRQIATEERFAEALNWAILIVVAHGEFVQAVPVP